MKDTVDKNSIDGFLSLVRLGINNATSSEPKEINWMVVQKLASEQGLSAIVLDGIDRLSESNRPPKEMTLQWIGEVLQDYEHRYELYRQAIVDLTGLYNGHGFKMMVLKGYATSLTWPKPSHRPCGDIDIWLFGKQKEADEIIARETGIKVDTSHHHHTVFNWRDFTVENHYDFVNVYAHKSSEKLEKLLKELGADDSYFVEMNDASTGSATKVYLPSPNLHALFLLRHSANHFASEVITLRNILDWAFHIKAYSDVIDWEWLEQQISEFGMSKFYDCIKASCVDDLGFDTNLFPSIQYNPELKDKVLMEILFPKFGSELPNSLIPRIHYKIRRWRENGWKHALCFNETRASSFFNSVWAHMLKPNTI